MINIAICCENDTELHETYIGLYRCFDRYGADCNIYCCRGAAKLMQNARRRGIPDILFYSMSAECGLVRMAAFSLKKINPKLISVVLPCRSYKPSADDSLLSPIYILPNRSQKQLQIYARLAYEAAFDAEGTFSYYRRPSYVHIPLQSIKYFVSEGRRIRISRVDSQPREDVFYKKLSDVENFLAANNNQEFLRAHQSYLVNAAYAADYTRRFIILTTGEKIPISRYEYYLDIQNFFMKKKHQQCTPA